MKIYQVKKCDCCGEWIELGTQTNEDLTETSDGFTVCDDCLDNYFSVCDCCGGYVVSEDMLEVKTFNQYNDSLYICEDCEDEFIKCDCCGCLTTEDNMAETVEGEHICEVCAASSREFIECEDCGRLCRRNNSTITADGSRVCEECLEDNYFRCEECWDWFRLDEAYEIDGLYFCEYCHNERRGACCDYLFEYHDGPNLELLGSCDEGLSLGFELELSFTSHEDRRDFLQDCNTYFEAGFFKCERDSSVAGFDCELISTPFSLRFTKCMLDKTRDVLETAAAYGAYTNETTGLHVHVATTRRERNYTLHKHCNGLTGLLLVDYLAYEYRNNRDDFDKLTGRERYTQYCSLERRIYSRAREAVNEYNNATEAARLNVGARLNEILEIWNTEEAPNAGGHNTGLNFGNGNKNNTFEFRTFGASLNIKHLERALYFTAGLFDMEAKTATAVLNKEKTNAIKHPYISTVIKHGRDLIESTN